MKKKKNENHQAGILILPIIIPVFIATCGILSIFDSPWDRLFGSSDEPKINSDREIEETEELPPPHTESEEESEDQPTLRDRLSRE